MDPNESNEVKGKIDKNTINPLEKEKNSKMNSSNSNKTIKELYLLDCYSSIKNKKIYKIEDDEELILIYYYDYKNEFNNDLYKKEDFETQYEFIYIKYRESNLGFLFPRYKYNNYDSKKIRENDIISEIKNSLCCKRIEEIFNIEFKSKSKKIKLKEVTLFVKFMAVFIPISYPYTNLQNQVYFFKF